MACSAEASTLDITDCRVIEAYVSNASVSVRGRFDIAYLCEEFNSTGSKFDIEGTAQFLSIFSQSLTVNTRANLTGDFDVVVLSLGSAEADLSEAQFGRLAEINYCGDEEAGVTETVNGTQSVRPREAVKVIQQNFEAALHKALSIDPPDLGATL